MKISIGREALLAELQSVSRIASTRSAIPALSGVLISAVEGGCELRATDTDISLRVPLSAEVLDAGVVVLPARLLLEIVRSLPLATISLEFRNSEGDVQLVCGSATFSIRTLRADEFPTLPQASGTNSITLPAQAFVETASKVSGSASRDETRPVLTAIHVAASDRQIRMVATDSYRLSVKETSLESAVSTPLEANIPARALDELARLAHTSGEEALQIDVTQNQIVFTLGDVVLSSRLIDGTFPNDRQLLPETFEHELRIGVSELRDTVRRVSLLAQKNLPLRISFSDGQLTVSAQTPDIGEAHESLPVPFHGELLEIGFNPDYLRDGLEAIDGEDVLMKITSPLRPGLLESGDGSGFKYLIMPIRLNA